MSSKSVFGFPGLWVLALPLLLAGCGGDNAGDNPADVAAGDAAPERLNEAGGPTQGPPVDLPYDLTEILKNAPVPDVAVEKPQVVGLATSQGFVGPGVTSDNTVGFVGQAPISGSVELSLDGEFIGTAMARTDGTFVFDYQSVPLSEGPHELSATAVMPGGSRAIADDTFAFSYVPDAMPAPVVSGITPDTGNSDTDGVTSATEIELLGNATPNLPVVIYQDGTAVGSANANADGDWVFDYTGTSLADGSYQFSAITEFAGEVSATSAPYAVRIDTTASAPEMEVINDSSNGNGVTNNPGVVIGGTTEPGGVVEIRRDGSLIDTVVADGSGDWQVSEAADLPDGDYQYTGTVTDPAGNASDVSGSLPVTVDTAPPAVPASVGIDPDNGSDGDGITNTGELTFSGTAEPGTRVRLQVDGASVGSTGVGADGNWSLEEYAFDFVDGSYTVIATAVDAAGNESGPATLTVTIDQDIPAPTISGITPDTGVSGDGVTSAPVPSITGSAEPGATVTILVNGVEQATPVVADGTGAWSWNNEGVPLGDGNFSISATAMNEAGAVSVQSPSTTVTIDQSAPMTSQLLPAAGAVDIALGQALSVTFDERVFVSSGQLSISRQSDGQLLEQIDLTDTARVSGDGTDTLTINPNAQLIGGTQYSVQVDGAGITDRAGNSFAGIADTTTWSFTSEPTTIDTLLPANGNTGVTPTTGLTVRFNEPVQLAAGNFRVVRASDDSVFATIAVTDPEAFLIGDSVVSFDIPLLDAGTAYYAELDAGAVENDGGVAYSGFSGSETWSFETAAGSVATVTGVSSPVADGTYVTGAVVPVEIGFSEVVDVTDGTPTLALQLDGETRQVAYSSGSGTDTLTFDYTVEYGDSSPDLSYASVSALTLNGARIRSSSFADSDLSLPVPGTGGSLSDNQDIVISGDSISADNPGDAGFVMPGSQPGGTLGSALSTAGDLNGDGFEDFAIAAPGIGNGVVYVIWGKDEGLPADIVVQPDGSLGAADGFRILGNAAGDGLGTSIAGGGDFNRDGFDDLVVGAPGSDAAGTDNGAIYVVWGQSGATRSDLDLSTVNHGAGSSSAAAMVLLGAEAGQRLGGVSSPENGQLLALGQDFDGDGIHDLVVGHPGSDEEGSDAGLAYVVFGETGVSRANLSLASLGDSGVLLSPGANPGWQLGQGVRFAGDFNGDGYDDLIVGAPGASNLALGAGAAYVVFGSGEPADLFVTGMTGSEGFAMTTAVADAALGYSVAAGDFNGDARPDVAVGAPGADSAYVFYGYQAGSYGNRNMDVLLASQGYRITSGNTGDAFGWALSSAEDFNADGADDLLVGAWLNDRAGADAGAAWLIKGTGGERPTWNLSSAPDNSYVSVTGGGPGDQLGRSASAADFNGDGFTDLIVGAPNGDLGEAGAGQILVVMGASYGLTHTDGQPGSPSAELIAGSPGDDTVSGGGGADVFSTGAGSDIISVSGIVTDFAKIRAGRGNPLTGMDALRVDGTGQVLNLMALEPDRINSIEMIDLGSGGNELHLDPLSLLGLSRETNQLYVIGDGSDSVTVEATGFWLEGGSESVGSYTYNKYLSGGAELFVDGLVNQDGISSFAGSQRYNLDTTSSGAGVGSNVADFPVLLEITDASIIDATESDGSDIRILGPDGSYLDYEIERWDQASNQAEVWVKMPMVYGNTDGASQTDRNFLTLLYGGGASVADDQNPEGLWQKYSGVWHLNESGTTEAAADSTGLGNEATVEGSAQSIAGIIGPARRTSGEAAMRIANNISLDVSGNQSFTVTSWVDQRDPGGCASFLNTIAAPDLIYRGLSGTHWKFTGYARGGFCNLTSEGFRLNGSTLGASAFDDWGSGSNPPWILFTAVYDGTTSTVRYYQNGSLVESSSVSGAVENGRDIQFGAEDTGYDELRYGRFAMSAAEIRLMFYNQRNVTAGWFTDDRVLVTPAP